MTNSFPIEYSYLLPLYQSIQSFKKEETENGFAYFDLFCRSVEGLVQNAEGKIYYRVWKAMGQITRESHPELAHDDFGKVAFHNQEGRSAPNSIKAHVLDSFMAHVIKHSLKQIAQKFDQNLMDSAFADFKNLFRLSSKIPLLNEMHNKTLERLESPVDAVHVCIREIDNRKLTQHLYQKADNYFKRTHFSPVDIGIIDSSSDYKMMQQLFQRFEGICFGDTHHDPFTFNFLHAHLSFFKEAGVDTFFMELFPNEVQADLDAFHRGEELSLKLLVRCKDMKAPQGASYNILDLLLTAQKLGIRVVGIDTSSCYLFKRKGPEWQDGSRIEEMNYAAAKTMRREKGKGKFIAWMGRAHLTDMSVKQSATSPSQAEMRKVLMEIDDQCDSEGIIEYSLNSIAKRIFNNKNYEIIKYKFNIENPEKRRSVMQEFLLDNYEIIPGFIENIASQMKAFPSSYKVLGVSTLTHCPSITLFSKNKINWMQDREKEDFDELCLNGKRTFRTVSYEKPHFAFSEKHTS